MKTQIIYLIFILIKNTYFLNLSSATKFSNYLPRGSSLTTKNAASNFLISPDKTFTCGFYTYSGDTINAYYFAIWFTNSKERTLVWMANRDNPVNSRGSMLTLRKDGVLVLTDYGGSNVWETNTSATTVDRAELLDSGNLVLKDSGGNVFWQSFDFPTDTLLPNQLFTKNKKLISRVSSLEFSLGYYSFFFDNDNVLKLMYDGPEVSSLYWPDLDNRTVLYQAGRINYNISRIANLDDKGTFISSDQLVFRAFDIGFEIKRRLTLDYDGNLRLYSLNNSTGLWAISWQAIAKLCDVHGLCGRNGICTYAPMPKCSCPPYFEPSSSTDWSKGCKPKFERSCSDSKFLEMTHTNFNGYNLNYTERVSLEHCRQLCLGDCRCQAFKYKKTMKCLTKGALFNGYRAKTSFYIRIPRGLQTIEPKIILNASCLDCGDGQPEIKVLPKTYYDASEQSFKWVYVYSFGGAIGAIEGIIFLVSWFFFFRKQRIFASLEEGYRTISSQFRSFRYSELKRATRNFKQVTGKGGFGAVYKGVLADARVVAVKKLENIVQGEEEFWAEVSLFGRINHMNLARIWGFCSEGKHRLLVYEYMANGSLDNHLFSSSNNSVVLEWEKRFKIALGTAKGLAYLHHECLEWVIHCDVKPGNILLDSDFEPKISDFGLVKLCQRGGHGLSNLSQIRGTKGYMAPEWTTNLPLTAKIDVYSYGVVVLELVKGTRLTSCAVDDSLGEEEVTEFSTFVSLAKTKLQDGEDSWMEDMIDPRLEGKFSKNQAAKLIEIGLSCVDDDRNRRPTMEAVTQILADCQDETATVYTPSYE